MPLLIGAGAVGLDTIQLSLWKRQLQRAADSAALAGGRALAQQMPADEAKKAVARDLELNDQVALFGAAVIEPPPSVGAFAGNPRAVRVVLRSQHNLPFWSFFTGAPQQLEASATAAIVTTGNFCMFATEDRNTTGINMTGNSKLNLGCGIATNAAGCPAMEAKGSTQVNAKPILAVGCLDTDNSKFGTTDLFPHSEVQQDPFADRPDPSTLTAAMDCSKPFDETNPQPGCYSSMNINSKVTLPKGTYFIKNGDANFGTKAEVTGTEVTLAFTGDGDKIGKFDMQGQAELALSAPKEGSGLAYPGMVMVRDRDRATMDTLKINGGQELKLEGAMYFPKTRLWFNGNSDLGAKCLQIVAQQLEFKGGANIQNDCSAGYGKSFQARFVRLVE